MPERSNISNYCVRKPLRRLGCERGDRIYTPTRIHTRIHTPVSHLRRLPLFARARTYRLPLSSRIPFLRIAFGLPTSLPNVPESTTGLLFGLSRIRCRGSRTGKRNECWFEGNKIAHDEKGRRNKRKKIEITEIKWMINAQN